MQNISLAKALHRAPDHDLSEAGTALATPPAPYAPVGTPGDSTWIEARAQTEQPAWLEAAGELRELEVTFDARRRILWWFMLPQGRPSFTPGLLKDMYRFGDSLQSAISAAAGQDEELVRYMVLGSHIPGIFNLGGDLSLFQKMIRSKDREGLRRYAHACAEGQYRIAVKLDEPICTVALVQGDALGGGFEAALAHDVIIAERSATFGLPEVLFGLFPGMGAYTFLSRRIGPVAAERMILSGRIFSAEELHEKGLVDAVVDDGAGIEAVYETVGKFERTWRTRRALIEARRIAGEVSREELLGIVDVWVDMAMSLDARNLRKMEHLAKAQERRWAKMWAN